MPLCHVALFILVWHQDDIISNLKIILHIHKSYVVCSYINQLVMNEVG
uniref:Uncharacterized protein n=1 Tax=Arundo donax TaxID=35708 RepID=A0A0A8Z6Z6_ARUDO